MQYKQIYKEQVVNPKDENEKANQVYSLTLYEPDEYYAPFLLEVESGNPQDNARDRTWEIMPRGYTTAARCSSIREVIKRIDSHQFEPLAEDG